MKTRRSFLSSAIALAASALSFPMLRRKAAASIDPAHLAELSSHSILAMKPEVDFFPGKLLPGEFKWFTPSRIISDDTEYQRLAQEVARNAAKQEDDAFLKIISGQA